MTHDNAPTKAIRRFDVFAEYTRQQRREKGFPEDEAKGYGIWLTKVVAPPVRPEIRLGRQETRHEGCARGGAEVPLGR